MRTAIGLLVLFLIYRAQCQPFEDPMRQTDYIMRQMGWPSLMQPDDHAEVMDTILTDFKFSLQGRPQIILLGDSITALGFWKAGPEGDKFGFGPDYRGWVLMLNDTLQDQAHIENVAFKAGKNTRGFREALPALIEQLKPIAHEVALVNIAFGANDAIVGLSCPTGWYSSVDDYTAVLSDGIVRMKQIGIKNIMLTTPPPVANRHRTTPDRLNCFTDLYARAVLNMTEPDVAMANIYDALMADPDWKKTMLITDALHLSAAGNRVMHDVVVKAAQKKFPHMTAAGLSDWYKHNQQIFEPAS